MGNRDPAFLFYSSDFLTGCVDLTMEERGQYITLICLQHQKGHLSEKTICLSLGFGLDKFSDELLGKFQKDENGLLFNERVEEEIQKRAEYAETRRTNGLKGGRPKKLNETIEKPYAKAYAKPYAKAYENHTEDEDENENENININIKGEFSFFKNTYNEFCYNLPTVKVFTEKRKTAVRKFLKEFSKEQFEEICKAANERDFLIGNNDRGWKADFDFLIKPEKAASILEGKYSGRPSTGKYQYDYGESGDSL